MIASGSSFTSICCSLRDPKSNSTTSDIFPCQLVSDLSSSIAWLFSYNITFVLATDVAWSTEYFQHSPFGFWVSATALTYIPVLYIPFSLSSQNALVHLLTSQLWKLGNPSLAQSEMLPLSYSFHPDLFCNFLSQFWFYLKHYLFLDYISTDFTWPAEFFQYFQLLIGAMHYPKY